MTRTFLLLALLALFGAAGCSIGDELLGAIVTDGSLGPPIADGRASTTADATAEDVGEAAAQVEASADASAQDDGDDGDANVVEPLDALGPFGAPSMIAAIALLDASNEDPSTPGDLLELYFMSTRSGNRDIWVSTRASTGDPWGPASPVTEVNTPEDEGSPGLSLDGLTMWYAHGAPLDPEIYVTTRASRTAAWAAPTPVSELDTAGGQFEPAVDEDSRLIFFASDRATVPATGATASTPYDIYSANRTTAQSTWTAPVPVPGLSSAGFTTEDPFVAGYGLYVWFASNRTGDGDLYASTRPSVASTFAAPAPVSELNTPFEEADPSLSPDFRTILFSSNRAGGLLQIYEASR
ncbi:MAG: hypothetical protein ABSC94_13025 [Polyangiaceae bacterium]|jgi:hypothetical protein